MNAQRLRAVIELLLEADRRHKIQECLDALQTAMSNLAGSPAHQQHQQDFAVAFTAFDTAVRNLWDALTPAQRNSVIEIGGYPYFSPDMPAAINTAILQNPMTPAVVQQQLAELAKKRSEYLETLRTMRASFEKLGVKAQPLIPGQAELGILLPCELFNNDLTGFQEELRRLDQIIRAFYEVANVTPFTIELKEISTSDPIIFLGMDITVLVLIGLTVKWCIEIIKGGLDIKKVAEDARAAGVDLAVVEKIEAQVYTKIEDCVEDKVESMLEGYTGDLGRRRELEQGLSIALSQMLARIERGMTVEIRFIPPPPDASAPEQGQEPTNKQAFDELEQIAKSLEFPQVRGAPVLQLTTVDAKAGAAPAAGPERALA